MSNKTISQVVTIRDFTQADLPALVEILRLNVPQFFDESEVVLFEHYLTNEVELYFVVERNGKIVGSGGINFDNNQTTGKISWDVLHPAAQGLGIGSALLQHRLNLLQSMEKIQKIIVRTSQLTYKFYEKNGFTLQEVQIDYWAKGFDLYSMIYTKSSEFK